MSQSKVETWVGTFVLILALLFFAFAYHSTSGIDFGGSYRLTAKFDRADGIEPGTDVRLAGVKIGTVTSISLDNENYLAEVEMAVGSEYRFPEDSLAQITSQGLLGTTYLAVEPGGGDGELRDGDEIQFTQGSPDLVELLSKSFVAGGQ